VAVRWPDGSFTGSVRVDDTAPAPVIEPEPEEITPDKGFIKEVKDDAR
jgi:hypothetical protein